MMPAASAAGALLHNGPAGAHCPGLRLVSRSTRIFGCFLCPLCPLLLFLLLLLLLWSLLLLFF